MAFNPVRVQSNPMEAFQVGRQLAGSNPVGDVLNKFIDQVAQRGLLREKAQYDLASGIALAQAKGPIETKQQLDVARGKSEIEQETARKNLEEFQKQFGGGEGGVRGGISGGMKQRRVVVDPMTGKTSVTFEQRPIPSAQIDGLRKTNQDINRLEDLIRDMEEKKTTTGSYYRTGPTALRFQRATQPFGMGALANLYAQRVGTREEVRSNMVFKSKGERFLNNYLSSQTGAQRGFKEIQYLATSVPNVAVDDPDVFMDKAKSALAEIKENRDFMIHLMNESGYTVQEIDQFIDQSDLEELPEGWEDLGPAEE